MNAKKGKALFANVVAPGAGHFLLKKWIGAVIYLLLTTLAFIWLIWAFAYCIIGAYIRAAEGDEITFNIMQMLSPVIAIVVIWVASYIDLCFFCKVAEEKPEKDSK